MMCPECGHESERRPGDDILGRSSGRREKTFKDTDFIIIGERPNGLSEIQCPECRARLTPSDLDVV